ncbi:MAG: sensor histidine kinase [Methyloligellaceae bacterium]
MAEKANAIFNGSSHYRQMWKNYALVFVNIIAVLALLYWVNSLKYNIYDQIQLKNQKLISESLILDKLVMGLRSQNNKNYEKILLQKRIIVSGFDELKSFLLAVADNSLLKASAANLESFKAAGKAMRIKVLSAHSNMIDLREKKNALVDEIISKLKTGTPEHVLFALKLIEFQATASRYLLTFESKLKAALNAQKNEVMKIADEQFSQSDTIKKVRNLLRLDDAERKAYSTFYESIRQYSDSERYKIYKDFNHIYNVELKSQKVLAANLTIVLYLLIFGIAFQFLYLFYQINNKNKEFIDQTNELRKGLESQKELNELQRKFVSMVSHEFRTPLAIIDSGAQKMLRRAESLTTNKIKELGAKIRSHINKLIELLDSTLHSQRMEAGAMELMLGPCDLKLIIGDVCQLQYEIHTRNTIQLNVSDLPPNIIADDKLIAHVVTNLVSNAVKYSPDGTEVVIIGRNSEDFVEIEVQDSGVGIPPEEIAELFNCFYRASTSIGISGTGIGLHLVKNIVDRHNGTIEVTSEVGKGSVFVLRLPKSQPGYVIDKEKKLEQVA